VHTAGGLTIDRLAEAKDLPLELFAELGCETVRYFGPPAVQIPYTDEAGELVAIRYRVGLGGDAKFKWKKGTKAATLLYGASRIKVARKAGYVVLVEGESDAWTLMHHG
jgi:putative DNA primase/helicase